MTSSLITQDHIDSYQRDGVVLIKGLFKDHIDQIRAGIERNMAEPGEYAAENLKEGEGGRFFDDYCNWQRIPEFVEVVNSSSVAEAAADLMQSQTVQMFHDHVLVKEPGTNKATPWHQDGPYYFVEGKQTVSFWSPMDPVTDATLRCVAGSHLWEKPVLPTRWLSEQNFYADSDDTCPSLIRTQRVCRSVSGRWSRETRSRSTTTSCMAHAATPPISDAAHSPCVCWAMMPATSNARAAHHLHFRVMT